MVLSIPSVAKVCVRFLSLAYILIIQSPTLATGNGEAVLVNVDNFVRAETAVQFDRALQIPGTGINKVAHFRPPVALDSQNVIRMNRDTLYSPAIVDISKGATLTVSGLDGRYMSLMVLNENKVYSAAGTYKLTMEEFDTPNFMVVARTQTTIKIVMRRRMKR